jgi:hypothetical protein
MKHLITQIAVPNIHIDVVHFNMDELDYLEFIPVVCLGIIETGKNTTSVEPMCVFGDEISPVLTDNPAFLGFVVDSNQDQIESCKQKAQELFEELEQSSGST